MVLGDWSRKDTLYGEGISVVSREPLAEALPGPSATCQRSPRFEVPRNGRSGSAFVPPLPERHMNEGSIFVGSDRAIYQVEGGQGVPVIYGGVTLRADGTMTGKRLAGLIELRDRARQVLRSQNEGWPKEHREMARHELNRSYDRFVLAYGPINKTSFSETRDGSVIRRMPNIVKFREDPDAMLVMALEDYDEITSKADKCPIMHRDVVGQHHEVTQVDSAEEGLLVSLNRRGGVNLEEISRLYGNPKAPSSTNWAT